MMTNFIKSTLNNKNEFRVKSEFILFNTKIAIDNLKIDTGCGFTTFPLRTLGTFTLAEMLYKLFFDTQNLVTEIEAEAKVNLTKIRKGVQNMIDYEARTKARVKEAEAIAEERTKENMRKIADKLKEEGYSSDQILKQLGLA